MAGKAESSDEFCANVSQSPPRKPPVKEKTLATPRIEKFVLDEQAAHYAGKF